MKRKNRARVLAEAQRSHEEATVDSFRKHPRHAAEYLNAVLEDGDREEILTALRYVTGAFGGVSELARKAGLNPTSLYRTLSPRGNPELKSLTAMLDAMGLQLRVKAATGRRHTAFGDNPIFTGIARRARAEVRRGKVTSLAQVKKELLGKAARRGRQRAVGR